MRRRQLVATLNAPNLVCSVLARSTLITLNFSHCCIKSLAQFVEYLQIAMDNVEHIIWCLNRISIAGCTMGLTRSARSRQRDRSNRHRHGLESKRRHGRSVGRYRGWRDGVQVGDRRCTRVVVEELAQKVSSREGQAWSLVRRSGRGLWDHSVCKGRIMCQDWLLG